jgi:hypothetical protein
LEFFEIEYVRRQTDQRNENPVWSSVDTDDENSNVLFPVSAAVPKKD